MTFTNKNIFVNITNLLLAIFTVLVIFTTISIAIPTTAAASNDGWGSAYASDSTNDFWGSSKTKKSNSKKTYTPSYTYSSGNSYKRSKKSKKGWGNSGSGYSSSNARSYSSNRTNSYVPSTTYSSGNSSNNDGWGSAYASDSTNDFWGSSKTKKSSPKKTYTPSYTYSSGNSSNNDGWGSAYASDSTNDFWDSNNGNTNIKSTGYYNTSTTDYDYLKSYAKRHYGVTPVVKKIVYKTVPKITPVYYYDTTLSYTSGNHQTSHEYAPQVKVQNVNNNNTNNSNNISNSYNTTRNINNNITNIQNQVNNNNNQGYAPTVIAVAEPQPVVRYAYAESTPVVTYPVYKQPEPVVVNPTVTVASVGTSAAYDYVNINQVPYTGSDDLTYILTLLAVIFGSVIIFFMYKGQIIGALVSFTSTPNILYEEIVPEYESKGNKNNEDSAIKTLSLENGKNGPRLSFK